MKIVIIGGGSVLWTPRLGCDFLLEDALDGSELVLNDIDRDAALLCARYLRAANAQLKKSSERYPQQRPSDPEQQAGNQQKERHHQQTRC